MLSDVSIGATGPIRPFVGFGVHTLSPIHEGIHMNVTPVPSGLPSAPIDASTIALDSWNPFELRVTEPIKLAETRVPLKVHSLEQAVEAASKLSSHHHHATYAVFETSHGFEAARAIRATWGAGTYDNFSLDSRGGANTRDAVAPDLAGLVGPREWIHFGASRRGTELPVIGPDARTLATVQMRGVDVPLVTGGKDLDRAGSFSRNLSLDSVIAQVQGSTRGAFEGAVAITRGHDGLLESFQLTSREDGPNRGQRVHFEGRAQDVKLVSTESPDVLAIIDGDDVLRPQAPATA